VGTGLKVLVSWENIPMKNRTLPPGAEEQPRCNRGGATRVV
jgi:hypothetical protein